MRLIGVFALLSIFASGLIGCGPRTLQQKITGRWMGAPDISNELAEYSKQVKQATDDPEAQQVAQNLAEFTGKVASRMAMGVDMNFKSDGTLKVEGKTSVFGLQGDQSGTWTVDESQQPPRLALKLGDKQFEGSVTWRDEDAFFFQYEAPLSATTNLTGDSAELPEDAKTKPATLLIRRRKYS